MTRDRKTPLTALLAILVLALGLAGCSDDDPAAPRAEAPVLPDPEALAFDFSFFDQAEDAPLKAAGEYDNFLNAYLRVALLDMVARLALTPPVTAFAVALHTPPSPQDDGSWIWVYTHVDGEQELQIRLRGEPAADGVDWELRVSFSGGEPAIDDALWFHGPTTDEGRIGAWTFHDLEDPAQPEAARIEWRDLVDDELLRLTVLAGEDAGDAIEFRFDGDVSAIGWTDADEDVTADIRWWPDNHGWLQVPDYNGFQRACWGTDLRDVDCE